MRISRIWKTMGILHLFLNYHAEFFVSNKTVEKHLNRVEAQEDVIKPDDEEDGLSDEDWEMFMESERGNVRIGTSTCG